MTHPRLGGVIAAALAMGLGAVACGNQQSLSSVLPQKSSFPPGTYSRVPVLNCLVTHHVLAGDQTLANVRKGLAAGGPVPEGLIGAIPVTGRNPTAFGEALDKKLGPVKFGPLINSVHLFFFKSELLARRGAKPVVNVYLYDAAVPPKEKKFIDELYGKPPPLSAVPSVVFLAGNVLVVWKYPPVYMPLSNRILRTCLAAGKT